MNPSRTADEIKQLAKAAGYVDCGITSCEPFDGYTGVIERYARDFPEAASLYEEMLWRASPRERRPWIGSIVVCVHWYGKYRIPEGISPGIGRHYLFDRRNPRCPDYPIPHRMKEGLRRLGLRVRRGGTPERLAAARSGVARFGRNCFV